MFRDVPAMRMTWHWRRISPWLSLLLPWLVLVGTFFVLAAANVGGGILSSLVLTIEYSDLNRDPDEPCFRFLVHVHV